MIIDALLVLACVLALVVTWSLVMQIWTRVPSVPTPHALVDNIIELADIQPGDVIFDLGTGDGRIPIAAKQAQPDCTAIGYELVPSVLYWGRLMAWLKKVDVELCRADAFTADLSKADVVITYLYPEVMEKLLPKLDSELRPGTKVLSHAFEFPGRKPKQTHEFTVGRKRLVHVYEW